MYRKVFIVSFCLVLVAMHLLTTAKQQVHNFEGKCKTCHLSLKGEKMIFIQDIDFLCRNCHQNGGLSHPSDLKASMVLPEQFPVDWAGRMTCATCHAVHGNSDNLLRGSAKGRLFCYSCHKDIFESHRGIEHPAHQESAGPRGSFRVVTSESSLDRISLECVGCHDSTIGSAATVKMGSGIWSHVSGGSHPVGTDYARAYFKNKSTLVSPSSLNSAVRLFDGKVSCGSCHNIFSKEKSLLTVRQGGRSGLCLSCHLK